MCVVVEVPIGRIQNANSPTRAQDADKLADRLGLVWEGGEGESAENEIEAGVSKAQRLSVHELKINPSESATREFRRRPRKHRLGQVHADDPCLAPQVSGRFE